MLLNFLCRSVGKAGVSPHLRGGGWPGVRSGEVLELNLGVLSPPTLSRPLTSVPLTPPHSPRRPSVPSFPLLRPLPHSFLLPSPPHPPPPPHTKTTTRITWQCVCDMADGGRAGRKTRQEGQHWGKEQTTETGVREVVRRTLQAGGAAWGVGAGVALLLPWSGEERCLVRLEPSERGESGRK